MEKTYIVSARRTAIGSFNGTLSSVQAPEFGAKVVKQILAETTIPSENVDELIAGTVLTAGLGQGPARQVALNAGLPITVPAYGIGMVCGSGMRAVMTASASIKAGEDNVVIAGGMENMSIAPYLIPNARQGLRMGDKTIIDHMTYEALTDAYEGYRMGITAENVAAQFDITREMQDEFAYSSQQKAIAAVDSGAFKGEIVPVTVKMRKDEKVFAQDEDFKRESTLENLATLRTSFKPDGTVTAGNASGINDGAAFVMLASEKAVNQYGLTPLVEIIATGQGGVDPSVMGLGPVPAIGSALERVGLTLGDIDILELNEAFAAQSLGVIKQLSMQHGISQQELLSRSNLNGGAIALGHPVGASGCRILVTLVHLMKKRDAQYGLASLCIGGGMGTCIVLRNVR